MGLPEFDWMAGKEFGLARATCSAKYMIRVNWSLVGGLRTELSPTADQDIPGCTRPHTGGSDVLCFAGPPGLRQGKGDIAKRLPSNQIPEDPEIVTVAMDFTRLGGVNLVKKGW